MSLMWDMPLPFGPRPWLRSRLFMNSPNVKGAFRFFSTPARSYPVLSLAQFSSSPRLSSNTSQQVLKDFHTFLQPRTIPTLESTRSSLLSQPPSPLVFPTFSRLFPCPFGALAPHPPLLLSFFPFKAATSPERLLSSLFFFQGKATLEISPALCRIMMVSTLWRTFFPFEPDWLHSPPPLDHSSPMFPFQQENMTILPPSIFFF